MAGFKEERFHAELAYYKSILKKHDSPGKTTMEPNSSQSNNWKQPNLPVYKLVKTTPLKEKKYKSESFRKVILTSQSNLMSNTERTVVYPRPKPSISDQTFRNNFTKKRTVLDISKCMKTPALKLNASEPAKINTTVPKHQDLLKEIELLGSILKKSSKNYQVNPRLTTKSNKKTVIRNSSVFKLTNDKSLLCENVNKYEMNSKNQAGTAFNQPPNTVWSANTNKRKIVNQAVFQQPSHFVKPKNMLYSLKRSQTEQVPFTGNINSKEVGNSENISSVSQYISELQCLVKVVDPLKIQGSTSNAHLKINPVKNIHDSAKTITFSNAKKLSKYKVVNKLSTTKLQKVKSPANQKHKYPMFKFKSATTSKINNKNNSIFDLQSKSQRSQQSKTKFISSKNCTTNEKVKKVNSKYKVINKKIQNLNTISTQKHIKGNGKSLIVSSPSVELLDNSVIDNLEKRLLVVSANITSTPKPEVKQKLLIKPHIKNLKYYTKKSQTKNCKTLATTYKVVNKNLTPKVESKTHFKKSPFKKCSKVHSSKYKVVNKNLSKPKSTTKSSSKRVQKKMVLTKYAIVNKHSPTNIATPSFKGKSLLIRRLYKSKNTIINKNDSLTNHSAKMIKSKYLGRNRKSFTSLQKHAYSNMSLKLQRLRGQRRNTVKLNRRFVKLNSRNSYSKRNLNSLNKLGRSNVLTVRGTRYSLSSSGRKLRRLPTKGQTHMNKMTYRIIAGRRPYSKPSFNISKVVSPPSISVASRVLHRSINTAITASSKKCFKKINTYCMFYNRFGRCNRGVKCTYIHDPSKIAVCTRFLRGTCKNVNCPFSHEKAPGKMAICSFYLMDACDKLDCPYRHEKLSPNAVLCKAFVEGYCPNGKECKKAHILICPKFILGECEKGSTCAFPHPQQKERKIVPNAEAVVNDRDIKDKDIKKGDILLERIARYFQSQNEPTIPCNFLVPRRKKIEEQPAFIPLCSEKSASEET